MRADGLEESMAVIKRLGRLPGEPIEAERFELLASLAIRLVHQAAAAEAQHVEDQISQRNVAAAG